MNPKAGYVVVSALKNAGTRIRVEGRRQTACIPVSMSTVDGVPRTKHLILSGMKLPYTLYFYYTFTPKHVFSEYDV